MGHCYVSHERATTAPKIAVGASGVGSAPSLPSGTNAQTQADIQSLSGQGKGAAAVAFALTQLGKPYQVGPNRFGPNYYDCSGLMKAAYAAVGIHIDDVTYTQVNDGIAIPIDPQFVKPGDLLFFRGDVPVRDFGHVAMAISATEEVEAPHTGDVVKRAPIPWDKVQAVRRIAS